MAARVTDTSHPRSFPTRWLLLLLMLLVATPSYAAQETPRQRLENAIDIYQHGGYLEAAAILTNLLYPLKLIDRRDIVRAKVYLGLSYYVLGRKEEAEEEFRGVFKIDPRYEPDPLFIPAEIITFIERLRPAPVPPRSTPVHGLGEAVKPEDLEPLRFSALDLLPLGIPQLRHGDTGRGIAFMASEVTLLAVNVGTYWYLDYYSDNTSARYPYLVAAKAVNISSFALLTAVVTWGIGDAVYRYRKPESRTSLQFSITPGPEPGLAFGLQGRF